MVGIRLIAMFVWNNGAKIVIIPFHVYLDYLVTIADRGAKINGER